MSRIIPIIILLVIFCLLDIYTYSGIRPIFGTGRSSKIFPWIYGAFSILGYYSLVHLLISFTNGPFGSRTQILNLMIGYVFTLFVSKIVFSTIMIMQDGGRFFIGLFSLIRSQLSDYSSDQHIPSRRDFMSTTATIIAGVPFLAMLYGITKGKYKYTVEKVILTFKDLPKAFDGFKLVQISDIHSGSFDSPESVRHGIHMINHLDADIVCFTGDLVNSEKEEIDPYIDIFKNIKSKYGKFAILGNHDYYGSFDRKDPESEKNYFSDFFRRYKNMGFDLLNNANRKLTIGDDHIHLIGVENWGAGRWFPKKGDLDLATSDLPKDGFKILLSHDPSHWDEKVLKHDHHMHLTLSGHTHGFQFGFQMPGFKWSPAQYRYPRWMGLYEEAGKFLYVNRGFGFLGFPGRIGMWPEITMIEFRSA